MEWQNQAIILGTHPYGERLIIVDLLTQEKGVWRGMVSTTKKTRHLLQPGCLVNACWKARLSTQLGHLTVEILSHPTYVLFQSGLSLELFNAACALVLQVFPQQEPRPDLFKCFNDFFLSVLKGTDLEKASVYILFEKDVLVLSGFSLDLSHCAATGVMENLTYISPKTGRAVSTEAAAPYVNKLLPLPSSLRTSSVADCWRDVLNGLNVTGHFLQTHLLIPAQKGFSSARVRLKIRLNFTQETAHR